ncbi:MAG: DUF1501 domain-containing protein [Pseudonocardiales bacterium]
MASATHNLVVIELTGGNDYLNTVVPYQDPHYYQHRPVIGLAAEDLLPIDDRVAFPRSMEPIKRMYDAGKVAVVMSVGYPDHSRSHFRSMDVWHTAVPTSAESRGWLGHVVQDLDPAGENPVIAVSFGKGLPLALAFPGGAVSSVHDFDTYPLFRDVADVQRRQSLLSLTRRLYDDTLAHPIPSPRLRRTGAAAQQGAGLLREAWSQYAPLAQYPRHDRYLNPVCGYLQGIAAVLRTSLGTRICYTRHGSFDTHGDERSRHQMLWEVLSQALDAFFADLQLYGCREDTVVLLFSEFGRRIADNAGGTDHGAGGVAFLIGDSVRGGLYGDYPALAPVDWDDGDVRSSTDFRALYASVLDQFVGVDPAVAVPRAATFAQIPLRR